jgi:hypothetical protein
VSQHAQLKLHCVCICFSRRPSTIGVCFPFQGCSPSE